MGHSGRLVAVSDSNGRHAQTVLRNRIGGARVPQMFHAPNGFSRAPLPQARESEPVPTTQESATPALAAGAEKAPAKSTSRDAYFDNAKYLAIVLVAIAHAWEPVMDGSRASRALYLLVYTFHM